MVFAQFPEENRSAILGDLVTKHALKQMPYSQITQRSLEKKEENKRIHETAYLCGSEQRAVDS